MAFETVSEATRIWIKSREFTVARILGDVHKDQADKYTGGAVAIFQLAPQDYHRFHSPVDGTIGPVTYISSEYYTVNVGHVYTALRLLLNSCVLSPRQFVLLLTFMARALERLLPLTALHLVVSWRVRLFRFW